MRFFRREIEVVLKMLGAAILIGLIVLAIAWGYEQRRQARTWQNVACAYRIKEVTRQTPFMTVERAQDACTTLARLGFNLSEDEFVPLPASGRPSEARYGTVMSGRASEVRYGAVARTSAFASPSGPERTSAR